MNEPIVPIVKFLGKEKYASFLSEVITIHYLYEPELFLPTSYHPYFKDTFGLIDDHMNSISTMSTQTNVLMNTLSIRYLHKSFNISQPCSLTLLIETITALLEDYDLKPEERKRCRLNRILLHYEDKHLRLKIRIRPSFVLTTYFHYPENPECKPSVCKDYVGNITHLHDIMVDNMLWSKRCFGEIRFNMIYTLYDTVADTFLQTNEPLDYYEIAQKYYYSSSSSTASESDELNETFTNQCNVNNSNNR